MKWKTGLAAILIAFFVLFPPPTNEKGGIRAGEMPKTTNRVVHAENWLSAVSKGDFDASIALAQKLLRHPFDRSVPNKHIELAEKMLLLSGNDMLYKQFKKKSLELSSNYNGKLLAKKIEHLYLEAANKKKL